MDRFLQHHAASITGVLSGFDRVRFRGTLRRIANSRGLTTWLAYLGVRLTEFKGFALGISGQLRAAVEQVASDAGRPLIYLNSWADDKEALARQIAARDGVQQGVIAVLACVERCQSFDLRSDRGRGRLELKPEVRRCLHYYVYQRHERFGFLHVRVQSWLPLKVWVCLNGREFLARQMDAAGIGYERHANCFPHVADLPAATALLRAQVMLDWRTELAALAATANPAHAAIVARYPMDYYWSVDESEWATDVLFRRPEALATLYPRLIHHGIEALACPEVMRYLGKRVNADGSIPLRFSGEVLTDLRPAQVASAPGPGRRGAESVRLKHRVNRNWLKMYDKASTVLRVETVINDARATCACIGTSKARSVGARERPRSGGGCGRGWPTCHGARS